jgi:hypothetical protein
MYPSGDLDRSPQEQVEGACRGMEKAYFVLQHLAGAG